MGVESGQLKCRALTERVIGVFFEVYNELGSGFLESVYEHAMELALRAAGLSPARQQAIQVQFRGHVVGEFRADLLVERQVIVELKAAHSIAAEHEAQLLNYLRATTIEVGLLLNFGPKPSFKRLVFDNTRKLATTERRQAPLPDSSCL